MQMVKEVDFFLPDHLEKRLFCTPMKQQVLRLVLFVDTRLFFRIHKATAYPRHPPGMVFDVDTGGRTVLQQNGGITFRMGDADLVRKHLEFIPVEGSNLVAFRLKDHANGDKWEEIVVAYNSRNTPAKLTVPEGKYTVVCRDGVIDSRGMGMLYGPEVTVPAQSALIMYK